ncbi:MAG: hypothetical protein Q9208_004602 [Pyrenodesmia sp. 3 TL-2023]
MDLELYEKILDGARKHYGSAKPVFASRIAPTYVGDRKRILLPNLDGSYPVDPTERKFAFLTARAWGERYFFWTHDVGQRRCVVQGRGRVWSKTADQKLLVSYREWLGAEHLDVRDGFGRENLAFNPPASDAQVNPASSQASTSEFGYESDTTRFSSALEYRSESSTSPPAGSRRTESLCSTRSRAAGLTVSAPKEPRRARSGATSADTTSTSVENSDVDAESGRLVRGYHLRRSKRCRSKGTGPFDEHVDPPAPQRLRKRMRGATNAGPPLKMAKSGQRDAAFDELIKRDRQYYADRKPPFILKNWCYRNTEMCVLLFDKKGLITNEEIHMHLRPWNRHWGYWTADVHGTRMILQHVRGRGGPQGCHGHMYRRWLGHSHGTGEIIAGPKTLGRGFEHSDPPGERGRIEPKDDEQMAIPSKKQPKTPCNALIKGLKPSWGRKPLTRRTGDILEAPQSDEDSVSSSDEPSAETRSPAEPGNPISSRKSSRAAPKDNEQETAMAMPAKRKPKAQREALMAMAKGLNPAGSRTPLTHRREEVLETPQSDQDDASSLDGHPTRHRPYRRQRTASTISVSSAKSSSPSIVVYESDEIPTNNIQVPYRRQEDPASHERWNRLAGTPRASRVRQRQPEPTADSGYVDDLTLRAAPSTPIVGVSAGVRSLSGRPTDSGHQGSGSSETFEPPAAVRTGSGDFAVNLSVSSPYGFVSTTANSSSVKRGYSQAEAPSIRKSRTLSTPRMWL